MWGVPGRAVRAAVGVLALSAAPNIALGAVTGQIEVLVLDGADAPVHGARVVIESPALIGQRAAETGDRGLALFHAVPPGIYTVTASTPTLSAVTGHDYQVRADRTTSVTLWLRPEHVEEVEVRERVPVLDATSTSVASELPRELMQAIPVSFEYWDALKTVPAVRASVTSIRHPVVHGGTRRDNIYLIDGVDTTDPYTGMHGTAFDYETVDRHEVTTAGHMAEYGGAIGLTSNVTTFSGGNEWSGGVHLYGTNADWGEDFSSGSIASSRTTSYTTSAHFGGPLLRDRLWLAAGFQKVRNETETLVAEGAEPRPDRVDDSGRLFAKLTWQIAPAHRLQLAGHWNDSDYANLNSEIPSYSPDQFAVLDQPTRFGSLRYTAHPTNRFTLVAMLARFERERDLSPQHPEAGPNHSVAWVSGEFGRYAYEEQHRRERDELRIDGFWFVPRGIGTHDIKLGVYGARTSTRAYSVYSGGEKYYDYSRAGATMWSIYGPGSALLQRLSGLADNNDGWECRLGGVACSEQTAPLTSFTDPADWQLEIAGTGYDPTALGFDAPSTNADAAAIGWTGYVRDLSGSPENVGSVGYDLVAVYAQDDWRIGRWTLRLGVRVEDQRLRDSLGNVRHDFDTTVGPRVGVAYDPKGNGRSKVFAHFARIYDPLRDDIAGVIGQRGIPANESQLWVAPAGDYFAWFSGGGIGDPGAEVAPNLLQQRTDEYLLGYAHAFGDDSVLEVTAIHSETTHGIESFYLPTGLGDPALYPGLQSGPTPASLGFSDRNGDGEVDAADLYSSAVICNMPEAGRRFDGLDVVYYKRLSKRWQLSASYSYADFRGTLDDDATYWGVGEDPDFDPRLSHNDGPLWVPNHQVKIYGSYAFPFGLEVGGGLRASSGRHYSMLTVTPFGWYNYWNGDPARISRTLAVDRDEFAAAWGIPATLPDGSSNPELDQAIAAAVPLDLRVGKGAYEDDTLYQLDLRLRYRFPMSREIPVELFLDILNVTDAQRVLVREEVLATVRGVQVDPSNISDPGIYTFGDPAYTQPPRAYALGMRVSF